MLKLNADGLRWLQSGLYLAALPRLRRSTCLWSKGISQYCDFSGPASYWLEPTESCQSEAFFSNHYAGASGLVWIRLSTLSRTGSACDLDHFVRAALPTVRRPFALVTTDGDASVPSELAPSTVKALLDSPCLVSWHTQNYDGFPHPKLAPIPIGLDLHTPRPWTTPGHLIGLLAKIRQSRLPLGRIPLRVFCDLALSPAPKRRDALVALSQCEHIDLLRSRLSQAAIWKRYAQYPFAVSASGNGLDSHRTWELLYLGCIVITKSSPLDSLYCDLPVVLVDDWMEARDNTKLRKWLDQYGDLTSQNLIWKRLEPLRYLEPIRQAIQATNRSDLPSLIRDNAESRDREAPSTQSPCPSP